MSLHLHITELRCAIVGLPTYLRLYWPSFIISRTLGVVTASTILVVGPIREQYSLPTWLRSLIWLIRSLINHFEEELLASLVWCRVDPLPVLIRLRVVDQLADTGIMILPTVSAANSISIELHGLPCSIRLVIGGAIVTPRLVIRGCSLNM
jgi:hypothetical protein